MSSEEELLRHLDEEKKQREKLEKICKNQAAEISELNHTLEIAIKKLQLEKQKTSSIIQAKDMLDNILESAIDYSIISLDLSGTILVWNEGAHQNYGYEASEVVNHENIKILHVLADIESGRVEKFLNQVRKKGRAEKVFERVRKDGSHFTASVEMSLRKDKDDRPIGFLLISKDITERKRIEEKLLKSNEELEQFAYIASHDLKSPLHAIQSISTWIEEDNANKINEESKNHLKLLRQRVKRMSDLIDGILEYSRAGNIKIDVSMVDVKKLLQEVIENLSPPSTFVIRYPENLPIFRTIKIPLSQVFSNLISNSISHHDRKDGHIEIGARDIDGKYEFFVKDDGPGIEPVYHERIFGIFQTLRSRDEHESTGIGLSTVKKIVESLDGRVWVESQKGLGTTFYFTWPKVIKSI